MRSRLPASLVALLCLGVAAVAVVAVIGIHRVRSGPAEQAATPTRAPVLTHHGEPGGGRTPSRFRSWRAAGTAYGEALTDLRGGPQAWHARLRPVLVAPLWRSYRGADLGHLPHGELVDVRRDHGAGAAGNVRATLHFDTDEDIDIVLQRLGDGWRVATAGLVVRASSGAR